jgi:hypothetical protein
MLRKGAVIDRWDLIASKFALSSGYAVLALGARRLPQNQGWRPGLSLARRWRLERHGSA